MSCSRSCVRRPGRADTAQAFSCRINSLLKSVTSPQSFTSSALKPLFLSHFTTTSCIGRGLSQTLHALRQRKGGLMPCHFDTVDLDTHIGEVEGIDDIVMRADLQAFDCRNNRL